MSKGGTGSDDKRTGGVTRSPALLAKIEAEKAHQAELANYGWKGSADKTLAANARAEDERYQELYRPVNQALMDELDENRLLTAAQDSVDDTYGTGYTDTKTLARAKREAGRQGVTIDATSWKRVEREAELGNAEDITYSLSQARTDQRTYNDNLRQELINIGRGVATSGTNMLKDAANMETNRNITNANAAAQQKAARTQFIGTGLGLALAFAI